MSFFEELKRRNVIRVGIAYVIVAWLVAQVAEFAIETFGAPDWVLKIFVVFLMLGFPFVALFAWAFEMTPDGIKLEKNVDRSQSIVRQTGRKLDYTIIAVLAIALAYFVWESRFEKGPEPLAQQNPMQVGQTGDEKQESAAGVDKPTLANSDNSIAVLPFANRSNAQEDMYFTDGIHDDLLTQLANIKGLKVISRTSVMSYRDTTKRIPEIAAELGVAKILEGGIQRAGDRVRINAQLIDVATDEHLWAETFDREMTVDNIFDIQSEITRHIVTAIRGELTDEEAIALAQQPTDNLDAYEAYLKAKAFLNDPLYSAEKYIDAEVWLQKAVAYDPGFAQAWALLVVTNGQAIWQGYDETPERYQATLDALHNAEIYGSGLPETIAAKAEYMYRVKSDYHAAEPLFARASKAKPGDSDLLTRLAYTERRTGHLEQAITHFQMAIDLDPANLEARDTMLGVLIFMRAWERADALADLWIGKYPEISTFKTRKVDILLSGYGDIKAAKALWAEIAPNTSGQYIDTLIKLYLYERNFQGLVDAVNSPSSSAYFDTNALKSWWLQLQADAYRYMGDADSAEKLYMAAIETGTAYKSTNANNTAWNLDALARAYAGAGQFEKAMAATDRSIELAPELANGWDGPRFAESRARILGMAGQREASLAEIERLLNTPSGFNRWSLALSPDWDFFRDDEHFNELARPADQERSSQ
jgi:TolB-like protein